MKTLKGRLSASIPNNLKVLLQMVQSRESDDRGQGLVEYSLIMSLVVLVGMVGLAMFGAGESGLFSRILDAWPR